MAAAIPSKSRSSYRRIIDGWAKTSSFNSKIKEAIAEDKEDMCDFDSEGGTGLNSNSDFSKRFKPGYINLYPNGTMLLYIEEFGNEDGYMFELAPKFERFDGVDTEPLEIAGSMDTGSPEEIRKIYEENKTFLKEK